MKCTGIKSYTSLSGYKILLENTQWNSVTSYFLINVNGSPKQKKEHVENIFF